VLEEAGSVGLQPASLRIKLADLKHLALLGRGTYGRVTLAHHAKSNKTYALKTIFKKEVQTKKLRAGLLQERATLIACSHPFIIQLYATFRNAERLYFLMEFVPGGELHSLIHNRRSGGLPDSSARFYASAVLVALAHLHSHSIVYRLHANFISIVIDF